MAPERGSVDDNGLSTGTEPFGLTYVFLADRLTTAGQSGAGRRFPFARLRVTDRKTKLTAQTARHKEGPAVGKRTIRKAPGWAAGRSDPAPGWACCKNRPTTSEGPPQEPTRHQRRAAVDSDSP